MPPEGIPDRRLQTRGSSRSLPRERELTERKKELPDLADRTKTLDDEQAEAFREALVKENELRAERLQRALVRAAARALPSEPETEIPVEPFDDGEDEEGPPL